jgi:hypothetical protein
MGEETHAETQRRGVRSTDSDEPAGRNFQQTRREERGPRAKALALSPPPMAQPNSPIRHL